MIKIKGMKKVPVRKSVSCYRIRTGILSAQQIAYYLNFLSRELQIITSIMKIRYIDICSVLSASFSTYNKYTYSMLEHIVYI